jgi:hypothetical protein
VTVFDSMEKITKHVLLGISGLSALGLSGAIGIEIGKNIEATRNIHQRAYFASKDDQARLKEFQGRQLECIQLANDYRAQIEALRASYIQFAQLNSEDPETAAQIQRAGESLQNVVDDNGKPVFGDLPRPDHQKFDVDSIGFVEVQQGRVFFGFKPSTNETTINKYDPLSRSLSQCFYSEREFAPGPNVDAAVPRGQ